MNFFNLGYDWQELYPIESVLLHAVLALEGLCWKDGVELPSQRGQVDPLMDRLQTLRMRCSIARLKGFAEARGIPLRQK